MADTIIRASHGEDCPYFSLSRAAAQDENLSWAARGLLVYLLSKPDDWHVLPKDLQQKCGRDKVYALLNELKEARYVELVILRDDKGVVLSQEYRVHESPLPEKPDTAEPDQAEPFPAKPHLTYKREEQNRESTDLPVNIANAHSQGPQPRESAKRLPAIPQSKEFGQATESVTAQAEEVATGTPPPSVPAVSPSSPKPKKSKSAPNPAFTKEVKDAFAVLCYGTVEAWDMDANASAMTGALKKLKDPTVERLRLFFINWRKKDFRAKDDNKPEPHQVVNKWTVYTQEGSTNGTNSTSQASTFARASKEAAQGLCSDAGNAGVLGEGESVSHGPRGWGKPHWERKQQVS